MKIPVNNLGQYGVVTDVMDEDIPVNAWTIANNIDFRDGVIQKANGYTPVLEANTNASTPFDGLICRPQWAMPYLDPETDTYHWIICGIDDGAAVYPGGSAGDPVICTFDGVQVLDITGSDITVQDPTLWNGGVLNGLPVINNGMEEPQMWARNPASGALNAAFEALTNWPSGYTADVIRVYKDFLVALSIDNGAAGESKNPWRVMWSDAADPFTAPEWTPTASNRAGDVTIGEGGSFLVDCLPLRGTNIIYTQNETWAMRFIGGNQVFAFDKILSEYGILAQRCAAPFKDGMHFVVTVGDIIVHDGNTAKSVVDGRTRDQIFNELDPDNYINSFVVSYYKENEMWFYYPTTGNTTPNKIAKWNIDSGVWSFMTLPFEPASHVGFGVVNAALGSNSTIDSRTNAFDLDETLFNDGVYNPTEESLIMLGFESTTADCTANRADDSNTFNGENFVATAERTGLSFAGYNQGYVNMNDITKHCDEVWLNATGGPFTVAVGSSDTADGIYSWEYNEFDPSTAYKVDFRVDGRYLGFRFLSSTDVAWRVGQYAPNITPEGER